MPKLQSGKPFAIGDFRQLLEGSDPMAQQFDLLEGRLVQKASRSLRHDGAMEKIEDCLTPLLPAGWQLQFGLAIATPDSLVTPDAVIVRERLPEMSSRPALASDATMVVEVADASLASDRRSKGRVYSRADLPFYWILNVLDGQLEVFTRPSGPAPMPGYQEQRIYRPDDTVSVVIAQGELGAVRVADLIP